MISDLSMMAWEPKISLHGPGYEDPFSYTPKTCDDTDHRARIYSGEVNRKPLYCVNVATGALTVYSGYRDAAIHLGISETTIGVMNNRVKNHGYAIAKTEARAREIAAMPDVQRPEGARSVWVCDPRTLRTECFASIGKAYVATRISRKFLSVILDEGAPKLYEPRFENGVRRCIVGSTEADVLRLAKELGGRNA